MPRTTLNLDALILAELRDYAREAGQSLGDTASYLLATALKERESAAEPPPFEWIAKDMGEPRIDTGDWAAVREFLQNESYPVEPARSLEAD